MAMQALQRREVSLWDLCAILDSTRTAARPNARPSTWAEALDRVEMILTTSRTIPEAPMRRREHDQATASIPMADDDARTVPPRPWAGSGYGDLLPASLPMDPALRAAHGHLVA